MRVNYLGILFVLITAACEGTTDPEPAANGYLGVRLSGAVSEHYEAEGRYPGPSTFTAPATFAAARRGTQPGTLSVGGWRAKGNAVQEVVGLDLNSVTGPGVYSARGIVTLTGSSTATPTASRSFLISSGEVELISTSGERLQGKFSATAIEMVPPLGPSPDTVHLTGGLFDVPIIRQ